MNKIYKVIFNKNTGQINVTSEVSKSSGKVKSLTSNENKETVIGEENKNNIFKLKDIAVLVVILLQQGNYGNYKKKLII